MKIKLSATFEGRCDICGKDGTVFTAGDEDTGRTVTVCKECSEKLGEMKLSEAIEKFGHEDKTAFEEGVRIEKKTEAS
jgi:ribosome-binding protein aMBF1 (putative translation factor)